MPSLHHYLALYQANALPAPSPRIVIGQRGQVQSVCPTPSPPAMITCIGQMRA